MVVVKEEVDDCVSDGGKLPPDWFGGVEFRVCCEDKSKTWEEEMETD